MEIQASRVSLLAVNATMLRLEPLELSLQLDWIPRGTRFRITLALAVVAQDREFVEQDHKVVHRDIVISRPDAVYFFGVHGLLRLLIEVDQADRMVFSTYFASGVELVKVDHRLDVFCIANYAVIREAYLGQGNSPCSGNNRSAVLDGKVKAHEIEIITGGYYYSSRPGWAHLFLD